MIFYGERAIMGIHSRPGSSNAIAVFLAAGSGGSSTLFDHVWTVLCSRAVVDRQTNNVSLQNVVEELTVRGTPKRGTPVSVHVELMTLWSRASPNLPATGEARVTLLSPSQEELLTFEGEIDLSKVERARTRLVYQSLPVHESGRYVFCVEAREKDASEWRQVAIVPLKVRFVPPEQQSQPSH